ncbi:MAG: hypothetical protein KME40_23645 [Komarekiella atlantica HA4396-MV6]|nr:hypothetical protein [Komarekiella atlantica HA4396-MV6]
MRSPTVGGYAIADHLHLLILLRQIIERLKMLQSNRQFSTPSSHSATKVIYLADNCTTTAFNL